MRRASLSRRRTPDSPLLRRAGLHEIQIVVIQARALEDIQYVMHIELGEAVRQDSPSQIRVAVVVKILASEHSIHIRVAAGPQQIVQAPTMLINAIMCQAVIGNGDQGRRNGRLDQSRS